VIPRLMPGGAVMTAHPLDPEMTKQVAEFMQARNTTFEKAEDLGIRLVETTEKKYGARSYENGAANFLLGALYRDYGQYRKAEPFLRKALDMKEATLGLSNPETAGALKEMGDFYLHLKRYDEAAEIYGKAVKSTEILAPGQPPLAVALHGLAKAETGLGHITKAKELYARAQKIMQSSAAGNQIGLSQTALMEVEAALSTGDNDKARQVIDDELRKNLSMEEELPFLTAKFQLERRQNNLPAAEKLGRQALKQSQAVYGAANPITGTTSHELAKVLALQGKTSEAKLMFGKASDQAEKLYGKESIIYKTIQADVQRLERK